MCQSDAVDCDVDNAPDSGVMGADGSCVTGGCGVGLAEFKWF
jgi:hypothetical protein